MEQIENFKIFKTDIHSRAKDLTGRIFGDYQILYRTECPKGKIQPMRGGYANVIFARIIL